MGRNVKEQKDWEGTEGKEKECKGIEGMDRNGEEQEGRNRKKYEGLGRSETNDKEKKENNLESEKRKIKVNKQVK